MADSGNCMSLYPTEIGLSNFKCVDYYQEFYSKYKKGSNELLEKQFRKFLLKNNLQLEFIYQYYEVHSWARNVVKLMWWHQIDNNTKLKNFTGTNKIFWNWHIFWKKNRILIIPFLSVFINWDSYTILSLIQFGVI